jgi:hypothetical protein
MKSWIEEELFEEVNNLVGAALFLVVHGLVLAHGLPDHVKHVPAKK